MTQLVLERQTTALRLALERSAGDSAVSSRDDFLAQASHDLRALMGAQKLYLGLLVRSAAHCNDRGQLESLAASLDKIGSQADRLINDLVDLVALEAGKLRVLLRAHSARDLLSTATAVYELVAQERDQSLSIVAGTADLRVRVDLQRGVQVLGNLLSNAIKLTPRGGKISVGFEATGPEVTFFVADTGPGVELDQVEHMFERFARSPAASSGLGLGLFIAAGVVRAHGGRIWLDRSSTAGSVFRFTLRRA